MGIRAHHKISTANASVGEIRTKEQCEAMLKKLEADIVRLQLPAPIFVEDA